MSISAITISVSISHHRGLSLTLVKRLRVGERRRGGKRGAEGGDRRGEDRIRDEGGGGCERGKCEIRAGEGVRVGRSI